MKDYCPLRALWGSVFTVTLCTYIDTSHASVTVSLCRHSEAVKDYTKVLEKDPEDHQARLERAAGLVNAGAYDDALPDLEIVKEKLPQLARVRLFMVRCDPRYSCCNAGAAVLCLVKNSLRMQNQSTSLRGEASSCALCCAVLDCAELCYVSSRLLRRAWR